VHIEIEALANELVDAEREVQPAGFALAGLPSGEHLLRSFRPDSIERSLARFASIAQRASTLAQSSPPISTDEMDELTLDLVRLTAAARVTRLEVPLESFAVSDLWGAPFGGFLSTMPQMPIDTEERRREQLGRLEALNDFLSEVGEYHRCALAKGLSAPARGVRAAISQIDKVLASENYGGLRRSVDGDQSFLDEQERLLRDCVAPALRTYRAVLHDEMLPVGRSDDQPGLSWLPGGDVFYQKAVSYSTSTQMAPEELHQLGLKIMEQINHRFAEVGFRLWATRDVAQIHDHIRTDNTLRYQSRQEMLDMAISAVRRAEAAAPQWFGVVPQLACEVQAVPEALEMGAPPAYYYKGSLDGTRRGTYFLNTNEPTQRFRYLAEAVAFHEAVPGHHFQLTIAQDSGTHLVHQLFGDVTTAEGWGLYSEHLADEMGLYSSDVTKIGLVCTDAWRSARLVIDTGLHALGWTRSQAIEWMTRHVPISDVEIVNEVDRYIATPGQALSYMVGRLEIERLRREATNALGAKFNVRDFHDMVLRSGPVPPPALAAAVGRWISSSL
jgi:uncharacterized protein (DUF885 family)